MNCEKSRELFADYLGEELPKTEVRGLQEHLKSCSGCRQELALLARTKSTLQVGWPDESIPQSLTFEFAMPSERGSWSHLLSSRLPRVVWASLGLTGCFLVCLTSLALLRTQIRLENGNFSLSFGQPTAPAPAVAKGPMTASAPQPGAEAIKTLLDESLQQFELHQNAKLQQAL
jgi:hypothetical protein